MQIEFEKLEQRPGSHTVPVKMTREELEQVAETMSNLTAAIDGKEKELRDYSKEMRDEIKGLDEERGAAARVYRFKREPKPVEGLWGFDFNDHGQVRCKTCLDRTEAGSDNSDFGTASASGLSTKAELVTMHAADGTDHPLVTVWSRPLGTKWFVEPSSGDVFGPLMVKESDLQKELLPETKNVEPFAIAFDSENAVPLLDAKQVGEAEEKIKADERKSKKGGKVLDFAAARQQASEEEMTDLCPSCGLPMAWHATGALDQTDPCKNAMLEAADRANAEQQQRTEEKYGADEVLEPSEMYACGDCSQPTYGKDLQPVLTDDGKKFVCFACEQKVVKAMPKKSKASKKKKSEGGSDAKPAS